MQGQYEEVLGGGGKILTKFNTLGWETPPGGYIAELTCCGVLVTCVVSQMRPFHGQIYGDQFGNMKMYEFYSARGEFLKQVATNYIMRMYRVKLKSQTYS